MPLPLANRLSLVAFSALLALSLNASADRDLNAEIVIDEGSGGAAGEGADIIIDDGGGEAGDVEISIDAGDQGTDITIDTGPGTDAAADLAATDDAQDDVEIGLDKARLEIGHFPDSGSESETSIYGHLSVSANWQPTPNWELQLAARADAYDEDDVNSFTTARGDYGDSFVRYRGDGFRLTLGTQTVVWGRMDGLPIADRVSTVDLRRFVLDELEDSRLSNPMLRLEAPVAGGQIDLVWLYDFRAAELPPKDSVWYPANLTTGRLLGISPDDVPPAAILGSKFDEDEPDGDGGFGARYTRTHSFADIGVTVARTRQSTPYFRLAAPGRFEAEHPRSWSMGADAALDAMGATWRLELLYASDNPVTRSDLRYTTTPSMQWGAGVEFHPGDGDARVIVQLIGTNLVGAPDILDRKEIYSVNGEVVVPFDRERWRAKVNYYFGLDDKDVFVNPELSFLEFEPHEFYVSGYYFDGGDRTFGGFHEDHSSINVGWRTKF